MATKKKTTKKKVTKKPAAEPTVDEVLAKADSNIAVEMVKDKVTFEDEGQGKEALRSEETDRYKHRDYIPGTRNRDLTALPEYVFDDQENERRRAFNPKSDQFHYCWVEGSDITSFKANGYRMVPYAGGRGGLPAPGLSGTGMYECDLSGHIKLGDLYLMFCEMGLYLEIANEDREAADRMARLGETNFHNLGYRSGVRTFAELDQDRREYN